MRSDGACIRAGIFKDAILVVDRSLKPVHGSVVVVQVDGVLAVRRLQTYPSPALERLDGYGQPEVIDIDADEEFNIFGVVTYVVNELGFLTGLS